METNAPPQTLKYTKPDLGINIGHGCVAKVRGIALQCSLKLKPVLYMLASFETSFAVHLCTSAQCVFNIGRMLNKKNKTRRIRRE